MSVSSFLGSMVSERTWPADNLEDVMLQFYETAEHIFEGLPRVYSGRYMVLARLSGKSRKYLAGIGIYRERHRRVPDKRSQSE